ncbi:MAG: holo-[acyl-carrier-protein] synthase [Pelagibacteraceae bacterium]|nr:holo-[acyl-carrier-protein] synthase [Pelagibacteraceae bacterium]|tara:strand:- start:15861 stop:16244 length:384 start_codon:yes stop_codon:yes gene_type:complete
MKIYGIGTDIVNTNRINKSIKNIAFMKRVYDIKEIDRCKKQFNKTNCFAKRFAAKEAFSKALGIGISKGLKFNEIIVHNIRSGKPNIRLIGNTKKVVNKLLKKKKFTIFLTLTDDKPFAAATVVISL